MRLIHAPGSECSEVRWLIVVRCQWSKKCIINLSLTGLVVNKIYIYIYVCSEKPTLYYTSMVCGQVEIFCYFIHIDSIVIPPPPPPLVYSPPCDFQTFQMTKIMSKLLLQYDNIWGGGRKLGAIVQTSIKRPPPFFFAELRCKKGGV